MKDLIIIGGGITGLAAAYIAAKAGKKVTLVEASEQFGGLLNTFELGNNRLEYYYHHFFTHDAELNWLVGELGLEEKLFFKKTSMGVFRNGKIYNFNGPLDLLRFAPLSFFDKIRFGLSSLYLGKIARWQQYENISCADWLTRWAGKGTTAALWMPLLNIKFGPYAKEVPLSWMVGRMRQRMNSRKNGDERLGYLQGSLQILLDALLEKLRGFGVELINAAPVEKINSSEGRVESISTAKGEIVGKQFLFTIPGIYLAQLLREKSPKTAAALNEIKYFGAICVVLELDRALSPIYWLNIADEGFPFGGVIEHSNFIPKENYNGSHIAYLSRYFAEEEEIAQMSETAIKELMLPYLPKIYPDFSEAWIKNIKVFKTMTAAPVCDFNFSKKILPYLPGLELDNLYICNMSHVYPDERSANNSIRIAAEACNAMGIDSHFVPKGSSMAGKFCD
jgi:protoporphyrinogen oxidase